MKKSLLVFITTALMVSGVWLLATADGTLELINTWFLDQTETNLMQQEISTLELKERKEKLKASILEHTIKKKAYQYQLDYMASKGY